MEVASSVASPYHPIQNQFANTEQQKLKDIEIFKVVFQVFDHEHTGFIDREDALALIIGMKKDFALVQEVLKKVIEVRADDGDPDKISFGEFTALMWDIER